MAASRTRGHSEFSQYRSVGPHEHYQWMPSAKFFALVPRVFTLMPLTLAGAGIAGCAVGPQWHAPPPPGDAGYASAALPQATSAAAVGGGEAQHFIAGRDIPFEWWTLFQSPALNALIEQAFRTNSTIAAARAALDQAQELVHAQRGFFYPSVGAAYQAERHKVSGNTNSSETIGVQGSGLNKLPQVPEDPQSLHTFPHNLPSYYTFYTAQLSVGFVPDVLGGNRRQVESLAAQREAQRFALEATYITLSSNVVAAAIQEASLRAQIRATQQIIAAQEESLRILRNQLRLGFAMRIDVAAQEAALAQVMSSLAPLQKQFEQTRDLMRALAGNLPNADDAVFELDTLQLPPEVPLSLPGKLLEQRPDVRAAEAQLHAASANVGSAVAAMLPEFSITGQYGGNATKMSQLFSSGGPFWSLYGDVTQPVFQGGTLLHEKRAASAAMRQAAAQYRSTMLAAYQNVADTLHMSLSDADALAADVEAERAAEVTFEIVRRQQQAGYVAALTLLGAETAYNQSVLTRIQAQAARYGDTVALFQALGGGWWNRSEVAAR
jgi:NodT family efflux transporter outer membrane factor (OMF) lipoprotein